MRTGGPRLITLHRFGGPIGAPVPSIVEQVPAPAPPISESTTVQVALALSFSTEHSGMPLVAKAEHFGVLPRGPNAEQELS